MRVQHVKNFKRWINTAAARILKRIEALAMEPRPSGVKKLEGAYDLWRIRVGDWRVVYRISDSERLIDVIAVRHRRDAYR